LTAVDSYISNLKNEFSLEIDQHHLMGERNTFRYLALKNMALRVFSEDNLSDILMVMVAAQLVKTPLTISIPKNNSLLPVLNSLKSKHFKILVESEDEFLNTMDQYERIRICQQAIPMNYFKKAAETGKYIASIKPLAEGRLELLHYVKELSISFEYHRYGSITEQPAN